MSGFHTTSRCTVKGVPVVSAGKSMILTNEEIRSKFFDSIFLNFSEKISKNLRKIFFTSFFDLGVV